MKKALILLASTCSALVLSLSFGAPEAHAYSYGGYNHGWSGGFGNYGFNGGFQNFGNYGNTIVHPTTYSYSVQRHIQPHVHVNKTEVQRPQHVVNESVNINGPTTFSNNGTRTINYGNYGMPFNFNFNYNNNYNRGSYYNYGNYRNTYRNYGYRSAYRYGNYGRSRFNYGFGYNRWY